MENKIIKNMNNIIETRKKVYENFPKENLSNSLSNMVLFYNIEDNDYNKLIEATKTYLFKSLSLVYNREFTWTDTFLEDNNELIMNLPNKTPNGVLSPKIELIKEYNDIQKCLNKIFENLKIHPCIKKQIYPNIRYKSIILESPETQSRPYYTGKNHSDAWVGHVGDAMCLIGVLGDVNNNTVEFNEPTNVHDNYLDIAESFDEGNTRYKDLIFLGTLSKQQLCVMDHACVHKTLIKQNSKPRISIDVAIMVDNEHSHEHNKLGKNIHLYSSSEDVQKIGEKFEYAVKESIFDNAKETNIKLKEISL